jgi:competence protein ComEC
VLVSRKLIAGSDTFNISGDVMTEVRKNIFDKKNIPQPVLKAGDLISLKGKLSEAAGKRNPGEFDYRIYLRINNIYKTFSANGYENVTVISENELDVLHQYVLFPLKKFVLNDIDKNYSGDEAAFLKGLITGERSGISQEMKESFVNAGVMHLIAVSGLNVAYIIISLTLILSLFRFPFLLRVMITIIFLIFYSMFTGNSASIVRASIMGILVLIAVIMERKINFYNIIGTAAMTILIYDSKQLFDAGFILSFSATISMVVFLGKFESMFLNKFKELNIKGKKITLLLAALFFTSLSAQIGTIPITANYFEKISLISLLANIAAVPLSNLSLAIGFLQIAVAGFSDHLSSVISEVNNVLLYIQLSFIKWCASLDFAYIRISNFNMTDIVCYYLIISILLNDKRKILFSIMLCLLIICVKYIYDLDPAKKLRVSFLDVGQGDCSVIQTPDGKIILVDCGRTSFTSNSGERTIAPYLRRTGSDRIDILIITHLHLDHIGGINYLLENFEIGKIIESGQRFPTEFTNSMDSLIDNKKIPREVVRSGDYINDLNDMRFYFLFPDNKFVNSSGNTIGNNLNNGSVAFILKYRNTDILFSGDIEKESERFLCDTYSEFLKTDVLKVAHHGSITSTTIPFIIRNKPDYAVISCGLYNKFKHPSDIILNRLEKSGAKMFRTDLEGAALLESDGDAIEFTDWK